jgi:FixJ family two-component response regulator
VGSPPLVIGILDDEQSVRVALSRLCKAHGLDPRAFASAQELYDALLSGTLPECLILDVQMPDGGALEVQTWLRARGLNIPAIMITGREDDETRARAHALGARAFFCKPMDGDVLLDAVQTAIAAGKSPQSPIAPTDLTA